MQAKVVFGNAVVEGANRWGWFIGHFITPSEDPRSTEDLEVKWAVHKAGGETSAAGGFPDSQASGDLRSETGGLPRRGLPPGCMWRPRWLTCDD